MAELFLAKCDEVGIDVLVTSTFRDHESQAELYAQGRTKPGKIVTNAKPGESFHNWKVAFDVVPMRFGKCVWGTKGEDGKLWERIGKLGESVGLEWGGSWAKFKDFPHFQFLDGMKLSDFQAGKTIKAATK